MLDFSTKRLDRYVEPAKALQALVWLIKIAANDCISDEKECDYYRYNYNTAIITDLIFKHPLLKQF